MFGTLLFFSHIMVTHNVDFLGKKTEQLRFMPKINFHLNLILLLMIKMKNETTFTSFVKNKSRGSIPVTLSRRTQQTFQYLSLPVNRHYMTDLLPIRRKTLCNQSSPAIDFLQCPGYILCMVVHIVSYGLSTNAFVFGIRGQSMVPSSLNIQGR